MRAVAGLPGISGASRRTSPLALAVLLHGGLVLALMQGLSPSIERAEPREVVISLLPQRTDIPHARPLTPPTLPALPKQAVAKPEPLPTPVPMPAREPQPMPVVRDMPSPAITAPTSTALPTPAPAVATAPSPAPVQESRPAPVAPPAPVVHHAPPAPAERGPVTVSSVEYLQAPKPDYPIGAKRAGEQGKVVLRILIDEKGLPALVDIQQSAGFPRLDEAARAAALRAVFKPHLEDGRAVPAYVLVPINFALK